jgi:PTH1 family peptidyl-tRNA hydrolase
MPLIVGLGNPGKEYEGTPHNVGFETVARLTQRAGVLFRKSPVGNAEEAKLPRAGRVIAFRPLSYMNHSGLPVSAALRWYEFRPWEMLVVCDDVNLPLGFLRMRQSGGPGGQKGLISIIQQLGTDEFPRLRIGVGGGHPGADVAKHVLSRFSVRERQVVEAALAYAADAVECFLSEGLTTAMNRFNTRKEPVNPPPSGAPEASDKSSPKGEQP